MLRRPTILFYCQHSFGMGQLVRAFALADRLAERFRVMVLNGGRLPPGITVPPGVELINLPPLGIDEANRLVSHDKRIPVERALDRRQKMIHVTFDKLRPAVVLIDLFPFGRQRFASELLPLLHAARSAATRALVVCSLRDILVCQRPNQQQHDDRAAALANEFFDLVLVHSDPAFARFDESFRPNIPFAVPVKYTGFVVPRTAPSSKTKHRQRRIVVSAGGGLVGEPLLRLAINAHSHLEHDPQIVMKVIAGPFVPEESWQGLQALAHDRKRLRLVRQVHDLSGELNGAALSISQAGYNTCLDVLHAGVPALLVPFANSQEDEQRKRALRLQSFGAVKVLEEKDKTPEAMAAQIRNLMDAKFVRPEFDLSGAETSVQLIESTLALRSPSIADFSGETSYAN